MSEQPAGQPDVPRETTQQRFNRRMAGQDELTAQREQRLRRLGAMMCGPNPPTDADLDVVEEFLNWLRANRAQDTGDDHERAH
jgi:hypothetical protein